jgi:hypothetical protein
VTKGQETIAGRLRWQAGWCERLGSPLYATILERAAEDVEQAGPTWRVLEGCEHEPAQQFVQLRLLGAVHRLVLMGRLPELAASYPSAGGDGVPERAAERFIAALGDRGDEVREHLHRPVQTNEVGRCTGLIGGFLTIAKETRRPLSVLEVGSSAGLNLRFDRYRYVSGDWAWGDAGSPVRFDDVFESSTPPMDAPLEVVERRGCDAAPLSPSSEEDRITLMSYVWPDQTRRFEHLRGAFEVAARDEVAVERVRAVEWARDVLSELRPGRTTVLFHSIVVQYLTPEDGEALHATIRDAGARATEDAPFAWLFLEPGGERTDVRLTLWPGGEERLLANAGYHSATVTWLE